MLGCKGYQTRIPGQVLFQNQNFKPIQISDKNLPSTQNFKQIIFVGPASTMAAVMTQDLKQGGRGSSWWILRDCRLGPSGSSGSLTQDFWASRAEAS